MTPIVGPSSEPGLSYPGAKQAPALPVYPANNGRFVLFSGPERIISFRLAPANAIEVWAVGGGGGGGGGGSASAETVQAGGSGGAGGQVVVQLFNVAELGNFAYLKVELGVGGSGGAGHAAGGGTANYGENGGPTILRLVQPIGSEETLIEAKGGAGGSGSAISTEWPFYTVYGSEATKYLKVSVGEHSGAPAGWGGGAGAYGGAPILLGGAGGGGGGISSTTQGGLGGGGGGRYQGGYSIIGTTASASGEGGARGQLGGGGGGGGGGAHGGAGGNGGAGGTGVLMIKLL